VIITNITTAATGDQPDPSSAGDDLVETIDVDPNADLVTIKTLSSGNSTPAEGEVVTFEIEVTNQGTAQATNVSLTDSLPTGITFTSSTVSQGSYDATTGLFTIGTLSAGDLPSGLTFTSSTVSQGAYNETSGLFTIGTLAAGDSAILTLTGTVDAGQGGNTITNVTTAATGDQPDPSTAGDDLDESVVVDNQADLVTEKTLLSGDSTPAEGDSVTFLITVTNNGAAQATGVSLTDQLPAGITFTGSAVTQGSYNSTTGLFTIGTLN